MKELLNGAAKQLDIKPYQAQAVLSFYEQRLYNRLESGSASWGFSDGARRYADRENNIRNQGVLFQDVGTSSDAASGSQGRGVNDLTGWHFSSAPRASLVVFQQNQCREP